MSPNRLTIALAGNPNSGKTSIFNHLTGTRQKVGNWPGVTVEKKEGRISKFGYDLKIVDLPGTYSLTPFSIEEIVARDFVLDGHPDVVIDIIDASNLERSLYLATQLRELDCKVLFALNMADVAEARGIRIDAAKMSALLDVPVVFTVAKKNQGIDALLQKAVSIAESTPARPFKRYVRYNKDVEEAITILSRVLAESSGTLPYNIRWTAIKLLENDTVVEERVRQRLSDNNGILVEVERLRKRLRDRFDDDPEIIMTDDRYGFIAGIVKEVLSVSATRRLDISRNIDRVLTDRFFGFPIFILFIWAMFQLTFSLGRYPMDWLDSGVNLVALGLDRLLPPGLFEDLVLNGIVAGIGSVIVFLPNILILFFCISLFEDTGYMSRAAFLMDKIMHLIGLHGKSFIPMLMGFGCNVPAIMATRTLESEKDRILTILITPFMSCSARLPVYIVLAGAFFPENAATVLFSIYLIGIVLSILTGRLFRSTLLKGGDAPFVMELPPYRIPMLKSLLIHMWDRSKIFLRKMGGVILVGAIIIWVLSAFPRGVQNQPVKNGVPERPAAHSTTATSSDNTVSTDKVRQQEQIAHSYLGRIGRWIEPAFAPLGIDWRGSIALLTGLVAKEVVISTMGVLFAVDDEAGALQNALRKSGMTPLGAFSMMVFVLLYLPCLATLSAIRRETASYKWAAFSVAYSTILAWTVSFAVYQGGRLIGIG